MLKKKEPRKQGKYVCLLVHLRCGVNRAVMRKENYTVWDVGYTDQFEAWFASLERKQQKQVAAIIGLLEERGVNLPFPYSSGVSGSKFEHMRELRVQSQGNPIRIFYAFDPKRSAILLIGGDKTGDNRFYECLIPVAVDSQDYVR